MREPPILAVLPDAAAYRAIYDDIEKVLHEWGWRPAFTLFQAGLDGASPDTATALLDPPRHSSLASCWT